MFHERSKHIEMIYHYVQDMVKKNILSIQYILTMEQTPNFLTKHFSLTKCLYFRDNLGVDEREC
jgi:hypothetical protein